MNNQEKIEKLQKIATSIESKGKFFRKKAHRARKIENIEKLQSQARVYDNFYWRASDLYFSFSLNKKFAKRKLYPQTTEEYKKMRSEIKQERKAKFDSTYFNVRWFFGYSLRADYGKFICEHCKSTFYHSPSRIYLGKNKQYDCICGHCVNEKMRANGQEEVFN